MTDKAERVASYEVPQVQVLLKMFTDGNISELAPEIHPVHGALYPKMEEVTANGQKAKALLEQLVQAGILRDLHFVDRLLPDRRLARSGFHGQREGEQASFIDPAYLVTLLLLPLLLRRFK